MSQENHKRESLPKSSSSLSRARSFSFSGYETLQRERSPSDHPLAWSEKSWTGPSPAMITISNPKKTALDEKLAQSRSARRARVEAVRRRRTAQHVSTFLHINIVVTPALTFPVTIEADLNIEHLSRYVEAEYAFRYLGKATGGENIYRPLECGLLYDVGMVPLRYTDRVGDVLNMNDVVNVLNAFEEEPSQQDIHPNVIYSVDDLSSLSSPMDTEDVQNSDNEHQPNNLDEKESQTNRSPLSADKTAAELQRRAPRGKTYKLIPNPTSDDRCISILHNKLGLEYFQQFCTRTYSVENLLFWLDTEMFQFTKSSSSALLQARYIYITYIAEDAPLQVNLTEEIRKDVPWPLPDGWMVDPNMFDEAQEQVFFILRKQMFPMFEVSEFYQQYLKIKREDRQKYEKARITGAFTDFFAPNLDVMRSSADLMGSSTRQWGLESNSRNNLRIKEQWLDRTMNQFFSSHGPFVDYFSDTHRLTTAQKFRKVQKEKKLAKFFGEKPSSDLISRQIDTTHKQPPSPALSDDRSVREVASKAVETGSDLYSKKKKVDKLEGFFGDRLGELQLMDQNLMRSGDLMLSKSANNESQTFTTMLRRSFSTPLSLADSYPSLVTSNDLSLEERRLLSKRSKKLRGILGEPLNEGIVASALTNPTKGITAESPVDPSLVLPDTVVDVQKTSMDHTEADHQEKDGTPKVTTRQRSHSADTVQTIDVVLLDRNSREYRRKKLEKLYQFLGEKIPAATLSGRPVGSDNGVTLVEPQTNVSSKQLSSKEKQANIKRFNKLERLLGEQPPSDLITNTDTVTLQAQSLANLGKVLTGPDVVLELVDYISDFDRHATGPSIENSSYMHVQSPTENHRSSIVLPSTENPSLNREPSDSDIISNAAKLARQRKLQKLKRFFGDQLDPVHLVEQSILEDLEKSINDEMTEGKDVSQLKQDLTDLRNEIRRRSASLQFTESDDKAISSPPSIPSPSLSRSTSKSSTTSKFSALSNVKPLRTSVTFSSGLASLTRRSTKSSHAPRDRRSSPHSMDDCIASPSSPTFSSSIPPSPKQSTSRMVN